MPISLVSIVLPVYNGLPDLDEQLEAIAAQDYTGDVELIVSDNGPTDGLRSHLEELSLPLSVRRVDASAKRGVSYARNVGVKAARGDIVAFVDHDDVASPTWLTAMVRALDSFDAVGGALEIESLNPAEVAAWRDTPPTGTLFPTAYLPYAPGSNFALWRQAFEKVGDFDEDLVGGAEDVDYSWRIQQAGLTLGHAADALVAYRIRTTVRRSFDQGRAYGHTSYQLSTKHRASGCPHPSSFVRIPVHAVSIIYLATVRNPWLPRILRPMPVGLWAHYIGIHYGALRIRVSAFGRRQRPSIR
ncbi:glycosyltransferase [Rhodococcus sp. IEGM 1330]|uniref:glycosyltransferase n=1 Tax=Rhodococcus sp. IEGM 1330 TaxID=3082225 RepID=UPI002952ED38|nr:glycosyltransferase [Rhodococcus sp. IEGM 1330]MDV8022016.1 glycosyltransferase [Rhodococcus sp. IEGM 1330]